MRKYFVHTVLGVLLLAVVGIQLLASPIIAPSIDATVEIKPETLSLKARGVITVFITEFSDPSYNVSDIDCNTMKLHVKDGPGYVAPMRCIIEDDKFIAAFDGLSVAGHILVDLGHMQPLPKDKYRVELVVEGMVNGELFEGSYWIRVMLP